MTVFKIGETSGTAEDEASCLTPEAVMPDVIRHQYSGDKFWGDSSFPDHRGVVQEEDRMERRPKSIRERCGLVN
jgi:hypothetical protein